MDKNIIFTFTGLAGSGKDTCAELLKQYCEIQGKRVLVLAYADWLKVIATRNFGYDNNNKEGTRHIIQDFATEVREVEKDFWVRTVWNTIDSFRKLFDIFIITDVRYENEKDPYPWRVGYPIINIYVNRKDLESKLGEQEQQHESEYLANNPDLTKFHFIINNNGALDDAKKQIGELVDIVFEKQEEYFEGLGVDLEAIDDANL